MHQSRTINSPVYVASRLGEYVSPVRGGVVLDELGTFLGFYIGRSCRGGVEVVWYPRSRMSFVEACEMFDNRQAARAVAQEGGE